MQNIKKEGEYYEDQKQHRVSGLWPVCFVQRPYHANGGGENEPSHSDLSGDQRNHRIYHFKPSIIWRIGAVKVIKPIKTEGKGIRPISYDTDKNTLSVYSCLSSVPVEMR